MEENIHKCPEDSHVLEKMEIPENIPTKWDSEESKYSPFTVRVFWGCEKCHAVFEINPKNSSELLKIPGWSFSDEKLK